MTATEPLSRDPSAFRRAGRVLRAFWRWLRTMRTAIILLLLLAAGAAVGSFVPQRPVNPNNVDAWIDRNPGWAPVAERLGLFDVFGSWWFMAIYALLLVSLVGCLVPRYRAFVRALRSKPRALASLSGQQQYTAGTIRVEADPTLDIAERVLKGKRFRSWRHDGTVAAEKGHLREGGSLIFHTAFLVLLLGMSIGKAFGFSGQALVIEGDRFTDTHLDYDSIEEGRFFNERHRGFTFRQDAFEVDWYDDGVPKYFRSRVTLFEGDREIGARSIEVNEPLEHRGIKIYQLSWGWAPVVRVEQAGRVLYDGPAVVLQRNGVWRGVVKVPQTKPQQVGFELYFFSNPVIGPDNFPVDVTPDARNPLVVAQMYQGDLGLTVPQSVYELDMRSLVPSGDLAALTPGRAQTLPNDVTITFTGLKKYSVFQIASNPGAPILLLAAVMILVGLIPALYSSRRRVWVRVRPAGEVSRLEIAGHALQRKAAFEEEFKALVREIDEKLYAAGAARAEERVGATDG